MDAFCGTVIDAGVARRLVLQITLSTYQSVAFLRAILVGPGRTGPREGTAHDIGAGRSRPRSRRACLLAPPYGCGASTTIFKVSIITSSLFVAA